MSYILGAGLGGLSAAYYSKKPVTLFEKDAFAGGRVIARQFCGSRVDLGAQFVSREDKNVLGLVEDLHLGSRLRLFKLSDFVVSYADHARLDSKTVLEASQIETTEIVELAKFLEGLDEKLERQYDQLSTMTLAEWYDAQFGGEFKWFIDALCRSVTFVKSNDLSALYGLAVIASFFEEAYGLEGGLGALPPAMLTSLSLNKNVRLGSKISSIECVNGRAERIFCGKDAWLVSDGLISALPANDLAALLPDEPVSKALSKVKYSGCGVAVFKTDVDLLAGKMGLLLVNEPVSAVIDNSGKVGGSNSGVLVALVPSNRKIDFEAISTKVLSDNFLGFEDHVVESFAHFWPRALPVGSPGLFGIQQEIVEMLPSNMRIAADYIDLPSLDTAVGSAKKAVA